MEILKKWKSRRTLFDSKSFFFCWKLFGCLFNYWKFENSWKEWMEGWKIKKAAIASTAAIAGFVLWVNDWPSISCLHVCCMIISSGLSYFWGWVCSWLRFFYYFLNLSLNVFLFFNWFSSFDRIFIIIIIIISLSELVIIFFY